MWPLGAVGGVGGAGRAKQAAGCRGGLELVRWGTGTGAQALWRPGGVGTSALGHGVCSEGRRGRGRRGEGACYHSGVCGTQAQGCGLGLMTCRGESVTERRKSRERGRNPAEVRGEREWFPECSGRMRERCGHNAWMCAWEDARVWEYARGCGCRWGCAGRAKAARIRQERCIHKGWRGGNAAPWRVG